MLGLKVMLDMMVGNQSNVGYLNSCFGKKILSINLIDENGLNKLQIFFEDNKGLEIFDNGQSCCEHRYMHTDDDLTYFVGATLQNIRLLDCETKESEWGETLESQFLVIDTSLGSFTVVTYNEHNGYYGGFSIVWYELWLKL